MSNQKPNTTAVSNSPPTTDTRIKTQSSTNTNPRFQIGLKTIQSQVKHGATTTQQTETQTQFSSQNQ